MGIFDFRDLNKRRKRNQEIEIHCNPDRVLVNGAEVHFPTSYTVLCDLFGKASRIEKVRQTNNRVYLWDSLGIYCASNDPEKMLMLLFVLDNRYGLGQQPTGNFKGILHIDGQPISGVLQESISDRPYMIRSVVRAEQQVAFAIGWKSIA